MSFGITAVLETSPQNCIGRRYILDNTQDAFNLVKFLYPVEHIVSCEVTFSAQSYEKRDVPGRSVLRLLSLNMILFTSCQGIGSYSLEEMVIILWWGQGKPLETKEKIFTYH